MSDEPKRMVEIPLGHARLLARAMEVVESPICKELHDSLENAIGLAEVRSIRDRLHRARAQDRRIGGRPRWDYIAAAVRVIDKMVHDDPATLARTDAVQAYVRDTFDALGISVLDPDALYVAITTAGLIVEMADNGRQHGVVDASTVRAVANISQTFTAALIDYLPPEARR